MKSSNYRSGIVCLLIVVGLFSLLGWKMGAAPMLNTVMHTAHDLLLNTCFYLMAICVLTGAIGKVFVEFGVVDLLEKLLRTLSKDKHFARYFKKYQFISLTNFGTAFGMGLIVIIFMIGQGYFVEPLIGLFGAFCGCIVSTRFMQHFVVKAYPNYATEEATTGAHGQDTIVALNEQDDEEGTQSKSLFIRILNSLLDGGRSGVDIGIAIIPGVLIISTLVMVLTFGPSADGTYTGAAYEGTEALPWLASKINIVFEWLFGFTDPHQIAFPITALGAVGAALGLVPSFIENGWVDGNAIAVFTAIGMCWSGFLSTHTAMLDSLGYRELTPKAILSHTFGGLFAALVAHWVFVLFSLF